MPELKPTAAMAVLNEDGSFSCAFQYIHPDGPRCVPCLIMPAWRPIEEAYAMYRDGRLRECQTILTMHREDLYPAPAYLLMPQRVWMRSTEGPEDIPIEGRDVELYREPTHWLPMLPSPEDANG